MSENPDTPVNECPHDNTEYDPGNYIPPYGWEQQPGVFCLDCGELVDEEYDVPEPPEDWDRDPRDYEPPTPEELAEEARNPL